MQSIVNHKPDTVFQVSHCMQNDTNDSSVFIRGSFSTSGSRCVTDTLVNNLVENHEGGIDCGYE